MRADPSLSQTLSACGYNQIKFSPRVSITNGGTRTPDLILSGYEAPCPLVIEIKDTDDLSDCAQVRDLTALDLPRLATVVTVTGSGYQSLLSCSETDSSGIRAGLDDCSCENVPVASVNDAGLGVSGGAIRAELRPLFSRVVSYGFSSLEDIPAEYLRFSPEAPDWELAQWVMLGLVAFAQRQRAPFTIDEIASEACGWAWEDFGRPARDQVSAAVKRVLRESKVGHLSSFLIEHDNTWSFNNARLLGSRTHEVRTAFVNACTGYASWKRSARGNQVGLL
jgi:hypothetical protein